MFTRLFIFLIFPFSLIANDFVEFNCSDNLNLKFDMSLNEQYPDPISNPNWIVINVEGYEDGISFTNNYEDGTQDVFDLFYDMPQVLLNGEVMETFECFYVSNVESNTLVDTSQDTNTEALDSSQPNVKVELISYEDLKDYDDNPYCEIEFTFTNNSFGTIYEMDIETVSYDDRGDKLDDYIFKNKIQAFGDFWSSEEEMKVGNSATSKSLSLDSRCQYIKDIYMTEVQDKNCNIRMLPENFNCLDLVIPSSKIDHINLLFE